jgi:anti-sigma B factor antagonist
LVRVAGAVQFGLEDAPVDETTHLVAPEGEIDALTAPQLGSRLLSLADDGKTGVVVDLSRVTFLDSTAIGVILNAVRALAARSARLVLVCPTERVRRPFEVTGLTARLPIVRSVDDALGSLAA